MIGTGMNSVMEEELFGSCAGLGNWHELSGEEKTRRYIADPEECKQCLTDLRIALRHDSPESGYVARLKLGEWHVLMEHLVPLFEAYRENAEIRTGVLYVLEQLTQWVEGSSDELRQLEYLQDYKEALAKRDTFTVLMKMLVEYMEDDEQGEQAAGEDRSTIFAVLLSLIRNLVSLPDPQPGDMGYTPMRRRMQLTYIRHFHDEGFLDFVLLYTEDLDGEKKMEEVWSICDIIYGICAQVDPEELARVTKAKSSLSSLLDRAQAMSKLRMAQSTRHHRFGTTMSTGNGIGAESLVTSVSITNGQKKGKRLIRREFQDPRARTDKKLNMFHSPVFVDLEEGSVREHNQLNPLARGALEAPRDLGPAVLGGLRSFFTEFVRLVFTTLIGLARSGCSLHLGAEKGPLRHFATFDRAKVMNLTAWILELHRASFAAETARAKAAGEEPPVIDVASVQGGIDLDMIQFLCARLREYGKDSNMHASYLVITLRAILQLLKTISVVIESTNAETRDVGKILFQNIIKEDAMAHLVWILKSFKSASHDPRVLSYAVEVVHNMFRLMGKVGEKMEFQIERSRGARVQRAATSADLELAALATPRALENLFHLLEKYHVHTAQLNSILVRLIYRILKQNPTNIVLLFELPYFVRITRISSDPVVRDKKAGSRYAEMLELLRYILRQFFKCAEKNGFVFAELLFPKIRNVASDTAVEAQQSEFAAILDNYEDEAYQRLLARMEAGETVGAMRARQKAADEGNAPWTEEENEVLRTKYPVFCEHPLCRELLAAELPEDSKRTAKQVGKQLQELGIIGGKGRASVRSSAVAAKAEVAIDFDDAPPAKRQKTDGIDGAANMDVFDGEADVDAVESLEVDLERLLDQAMESMDSDPFFDAPTAVSVSASTPAAASSAVAGSKAIEPETSNSQIERELNELLGQDSQSQPGMAASPGFASQRRLASPLEPRPASPAPAGAKASAGTALGSQDDDAENAAFWDNLFEGPGALEASGDKNASNEDSLEHDLGRILDDAAKAPMASVDKVGGESGSSGRWISPSAGDSQEPDPSGRKSVAEAGTSQGAVASQLSQDLELALEQIMDEDGEGDDGTEGGLTGTAASQKSMDLKEVGDDRKEGSRAILSGSAVESSQMSQPLELELERIMDED